MLRSICEFGPFTEAGQGLDPTVTEWYTGVCPQTGASLKLPRTKGAEAIARVLMAEFAQAPPTAEGKMFGVLIVQTPQGKVGVVKAFSGLLNGWAKVPGWVPPIPGREVVAVAEQSTLHQLTEIKQELLALQRSPVRDQLNAATATFAAQWQHLTQAHAARKQARQHQRQHLLARGEAGAIALAALDAESRRDGRERRNWKRDRDRVLAPLQAQATALEQQIQSLKQRRKHLSHQLQAQMHMAYSLSNFAGQSTSLSALSSVRGIPTGTGECCAPKLLHYAASHQLEPVAIAEFWWGPANPKGDKRSGEFYGPCRDRCQPIMGFLLSGLRSPLADSLPPPLPLLYQDEWLLAVDKPAGLLSVPGRDRGANAWMQLQQDLATDLFPVHRLDQDTSGVLLFARDRETQRQIQRQFQQRQVEKVYVAIVDGVIQRDRGSIHLPLRPDAQRRPYQLVDWHHGKPSDTEFIVLSRSATTTRLELRPRTGRTHQLRVHAAHPDGLNAPIVGDRLYGPPATAPRLCLHACALTVEHPHKTHAVVLRSATPF